MDGGDPLGCGPVIGAGHHQAARDTGEVGERKVEESGREWDDDRTDGAGAQTPKEPEKLAGRVIEHERSADGWETEQCSERVARGKDRGSLTGAQQRLRHQCFPDATTKQDGEPRFRTVSRAHVM